MSGNPNTNQSPDTVSPPDVQDSVEQPMRPHKTEDQQKPPAGQQRQNNPQQS